MDSLFNYFASSDYLLAALINIGVSLVISVIFVLIVSLKVRSTKGFFITAILMPVIISSIISMMTIFLTNATSSNIARIVTIAVALGLIRFRSYNAKAEELLVLFAGVAVGLISGLGYVAFAAIIGITIALVYLLLANLKVFDGKRFAKDRLLKITIPESLEYNDVFKEPFQNFLRNSELVEVKTTGMGSLFKLSYKIQMKNQNQEKEFIDELRVRNGNLEISILPYVPETNSL